MAQRKNILKQVPPEKLEALDRLRENVRHAEAHGQTDTAHHEMLASLEAELGLIPSGKTEGQKPDEVNNGESDV